MTTVVASMPPEPPEEETEPQCLFRAITSSTKQIHQLLKCISFYPKVHVQITTEGIRFVADYARVMQGTAFLDKALFTTYHLCPAEDEDCPLPQFQINLSAFLEALQIFGASDQAAKQAKQDSDSAYRSNLRNYRPDAFTNPALLGLPGTCCLLHEQTGGPLTMLLDEAGIKTRCDLVTYAPDIPDNIPFDRTDVAFKFIMPSRCLLDALAELAPMLPARIAISAEPDPPFLTLRSSGAMGSATVDFSGGRDLLETFSVRQGGRWAQAFKFDLVRFATEAMRVASKVSFRGDGQGVLSLQFMVQVEGGSASFLDFRFVPYVLDGEEGASEGEGG